MNFRGSWRRFAVIVLGMSVAALLGGCAITPEPITDDEHAAFVGDKVARLTVDQAPADHPIDLAEATARALKYNLDGRVQAMQRAVQIQALEIASEEMLPDLTASSGYAGRNNESGSTSRSLLTGRQSLEASTGTEKETVASSLTFGWNVLDFGLSYVRARQAADQALIEEETRRKVINKIVEDVRTAYWRAASGERLLARMKSLERRTVAAMASSQTLANGGEVSPLQALTYQRELISIRRDIQTLEGELLVAKAELGSLINIPPGTTFKIAHMKPEAPEIGLSTRDLIEIALSHRPELTEIALKKRINEKEATAALLSLLPGIQLYAGENADTNEYLFNNNWVSWGAKAGFNLMRVFKYPAQLRGIDAKSELIDEQALALTMAVMTQVHVSRIRYLHALKELRTARDYLAVQKRILDQIRAQKTAGRMSEQALVREELNTLLAETKSDIAYANLENAIGNLYLSIGVDPLGADVAEDMDIQVLADVLRNAKPGMPRHRAPVALVGEAVIPSWTTEIR